MFPYIILTLLLVATILTAVLVIVGPSVWDRLLGLSLISSKIIIIIVVFSFFFTPVQAFYLDIGLAFALLGFVGTTSLAKFLRQDKVR
jgi:Multisubunit Na+/H+ antiporter, MnhF subunit